MRKPGNRSRAATSLAFVLTLAFASANAASPDELLAGYTALAAGAADAARGKAFFTSPHGRDWACASCHGATPVAEGRHAVTGRPIRALAPAANAARFTDREKVEKWFRRNCADVVGRECTNAEKADVLTWLISLKR
jgi:hypothetical protein